MKFEMGLVLIDKKQIEARVYGSCDGVRWRVLTQQRWGFAGVWRKRALAQKILEMQNGQWRVYCRQLNLEVVQELKREVKWPIQMISESYEKELIYKGILMEL